MKKKRSQYHAILLLKKVQQIAILDYQIYTYSGLYLCNDCNKLCNFN